MKYQNSYNKTLTSLTSLNQPPPVHDWKYATLRQEVWGEHEEFKQLLGLLFDLNVFEMLKNEKKEVDSPLDAPIELKMFEAVFALKEAGLSDKLIPQLVASSDSKFALYFAKGFRFFRFVCRRNGLESPGPTKICSLLFRLVAILSQRLAILYKLTDASGRENYKQVFDKLLDNLKFGVERLFHHDPRAATDELSIAASDAKSLLQFGFDEFFVFLCKLDPSLRLLCEKVAGFLPEQGLGSLVDELLSYLVAIYYSKFEKTFDINVGQNKKLDELNRVEQESENVVNSSFKSAYSAFILGKKNNLEFFLAYGPYLQNSNLALCINSIPTTLVLTKLLTLRNKINWRMIEIIERKFSKNPLFAASSSLLTDPYWQPIVDLFKSDLSF